MIYRNVIATALALAVCIVGSSKAAAQRHGGAAGASFGHGSFRGSGSVGMTPGLASGGSRFRPGVSRDFRGDHHGFHHRRFNNFFFFDDFEDPFFDYPFAYYGYYPDNYYSYNYGYGRDAYQVNGGYTGSLVEEVQLRLAHAGYYHAPIDGVSGNATRAAIRQYERAHRLPIDGQIRGPLLTTMGLR